MHLRRHSMEELAEVPMRTALDPGRRTRGKVGAAFGFSANQIKC